MIIERINTKGEKVTRDLNITSEELYKWNNTVTTSKLAFPNLSSSDLLFFDTGMSVEEYNEILNSKKGNK